MERRSPNQSVLSVVVGLLVAVGVSALAAKRSQGPVPRVTEPTHAPQTPTPHREERNEPHRDERSGPHWADRAALGVAVVSALVSVIAMGVTIQLGLRPYPADPTQLPTFGTPEREQYLESAEDSYALFQFLRDNAGRKVRVNVGFAMDGPFHLIDDGELVVPGPDCPAGWRPGGAYCDTVVLQVDDVSEERRGLVFQHGANVLSGYFADEGSIGTWTGAEVIAITPMTAVEAVS
jgi:hypothetical protein